MGSENTYKGMRVFDPKEHLLLDTIVTNWRDSAESFGYMQYKTAVLEPKEYYTNKTSEEIVQQQMYTFKDKKGREIVLRPEITPGVAMMVKGIQREYKKPIKIYSIGSVYRYEAPQKGRSREHIQFNVDIFGVQDYWAEVEVIEVALQSMERIGIASKDIMVKINDRNSMEEKLSALGVSKSKHKKIFHILDRVEKESKQTIEKELKKVTHITYKDIQKALKEVPSSVEKVISALPSTINAVYDPSIVRGFDYYTGIVFEIYAKDTRKISRSLAAGGRYDNLIKQYGGSPLSAVGFGMGDVGIAELIEKKAEQHPLKANVVAFIESETTYKMIQTLIRSIRKKGISVSYIGIVPKQKKTDVYAYWEKMGALYTVEQKGDGYVIRDLKKRKDILKKTKKDVLTFLT